MSKANKLAFVLGGGGARGGLQVGALRILLQAGVQPDLWIGTSVGAVNAAYMALYGFSPESLNGLQKAWLETISADLMPSNYRWLTIRAVFGRNDPPGENRFRRFFINQGLAPDLRFGDLDAPLFMVSTDLTSGQASLYGVDPDHLVLEGLLASTGLPPWTSPISHDGHQMIDGGIVCNLPIEPAVNLGATEIIALDISDSRQASQAFQRLGPMPGQLLNAIEQRQTDLEKELAQAKGIPVHHIHLLAEKLVPIWDFSHSGSLIEIGAKRMQEYLDDHPDLINGGKTSWWQKLWPGSSGKKY
ncbi:MAG: patatin-like phospholipase family protein [Anaerolineales bacterium]|nr:patatin-like phospholipase family protein [Anaerolineales bacterium]